MMTAAEIREVALRELTATQFEAWHLHVYAGIPKRRVARMLGLSRAALQGRLDAADRRIVRCLPDHLADGAAVVDRGGEDARPLPAAEARAEAGRGCPPAGRGVEGGASARTEAA